MRNPARNEIYDIAVVGGGINGCGIARDAAGRGLKVFLCEQADLGGGTSSASSKLIHGGLRYLEQGQFKLVRESLRERKTLRKTAPHLITPLRFILPHHPGLRPRWLIHAGLLLYDLIAGTHDLPRSKPIKLDRHNEGATLRAEFTSGFEYTDCRTDDSRLVITVAKDAHRLGATIARRTRCESVVRSDGLWEIILRREDGSSAFVVRAKTLVNATGPWVARLAQLARLRASNADALKKPAVKLVQGSHIVVKKWFAGTHAYLLQNHDRRIVFVIPFQRDLVIIGTTETECRGDPANARITPAERDYLCALVNRYFTVTLTRADVLWSYSGVRPLYDDGAAHDALREVSRDYVIALDAATDSPPMITIYGGKLTTFRRLAEAVLARLSPYFPDLKPPWTAESVLPGGQGGNNQIVDALTTAHPFLPRALLSRYASAYGSDAFDMLGEVKVIEDMGERFGDDLYQVEAEYLVRNEWAVTAEDLLWRRSKLGLGFDRDQVAALERWLAAHTDSAAVRASSCAS